MHFLIGVKYKKVKGDSLTITNCTIAILHYVSQIYTYSYYEKYTAPQTVYEMRLIYLFFL